ncbi:vitamin D3 hydroxylase-associated protein-like [Mizuhopecten yessoensis]|uniref:fatty acid amide hydrolase n=1 Tax=Mizuhopecten yessoensis TaxID=6573 RepID=A0A210R773_MIZYE|nr:vitamin D3 hydroxylase-associated protein-like [Mizuhopecten yessoensis]OWF56746.1 Fatty acid amide hydrolase 1 [Mizuhopecten yessoensis]
MSGLVDATTVPMWVKYVVLFTTGGTALMYLEGAYRRYIVRQVIRKRKEKAQMAMERVRTQVNEQQVDGKLSADILNMTAVQLQTALQAGKVKAVDVLQTYQKKAIQENDRFNFILEPILEARDLAEARDQQQDNKKKLHGIPISVKESFNFKGQDTTGGCASLIGKLAREDAVLVQVLKDQGAVPFVRTNIPQTMLSFDCSNPIYGKTLNPHDPTRTPGGSSGGEGAILASEASILGLGSDIAGSVRIPCHFCGVTGLKPTHGRLSTKGMLSFSSHQNIVSAVGGPMARDVDGVVLLMKALLSPLHFKLDPSVPPIPFQDKEYADTRRLRIGYYTSHGYVDPVPACTRAVLITKEALEQKGHTLIPFEPPRIPYAISQLYMKVVCGDGGKSVTEYMEDDVVDPSMSMMMFNNRRSHPVRHFLASLAGWLSNDKTHEQMLRSMIGCKSVHEWGKLYGKVRQYKDEFYDAWTRQKLDVVICPQFGFVAPPYGYLFKTFGGGIFAPIYNLLNYPAGCLPVTAVSANDIDGMKNYPENTAFEKNIKKVTEGSEGLPVGLQVVGQQWQEELVLRVMKEIEEAIKS